MNTINSRLGLKNTADRVGLRYLRSASAVALAHVTLQHCMLRRAGTIFIDWGSKSRGPHFDRGVHKCVIRDKKTQS